MPTGTIYIPPGTWTIRDTINIRNANFLNIVGDSPATTIIKWVGSASSPNAPYPDMFRMFDVAYVKFDRLTLDGNHQARLGVHLFRSGCYDGGKCDLSSKQLQAVGGIAAVTGIQFNDDIFRNMEIGLAAGRFSSADSDGQLDLSVGLLPDQSPAHNGTVGISGSNAGDVVVRRSRFDQISFVGINTNGSNVFNWLIADSEFTNSYRGIQVTDHGGIARG